LNAAVLPAAGDRDGAKLEVEVEGFWGSGRKPELWKFPAHVTANAAKTVVVGIDPPGTASYFFEASHPASDEAER
jgi:hypothetical protein